MGNGWGKCTKNPVVATVGGHDMNFSRESLLDVPMFLVAGSNYLT